MTSAFTEGHFRVLEDIARELSGDVNFPTCMDAALLIRDTLSDPFADLSRVCAVVGAEPLISSKLLRLANSAHYNPSGKSISDVGIAVARLGFENVRTLSLAVAMDQMLRAKHLAAYDDIAHKVWAHSVEVAAIARTLARHQGTVRPEDAMMTGLVHDIGVFYLLYRAAAYPAYRDNREAMIELLAGWHEGIGETMLHALGVPTNIADAVHDHDHLRTLGPIPDLGGTLYLANLLAGSDTEWRPCDLSTSDLEAMASQAASHQEWLVQAAPDIDELRSALGICN